MHTVTRPPEQDLPQPPRGRHLRARDGILVVVIAVVLLVLFEGTSLRNAGEEMQPGFERDVVLAVGKPTGWVADRTPLHRADLFGWLSSDEKLGKSGGFDTPVRSAADGRVAPITRDSFDPQALGERASPPRPLHVLLATGDSMVMPLDLELSRRLADQGGVRAIREPHLGTGVSKSGFVDWGKLAARQVRKLRPDAIVVFIGANEGFSMPGPDGHEVDCCGRDWAAVYASRVRRMMDTYRQGGAARVYWLTLPLPRDGARQQVARAVNAAIDVAAEPYRSQVRVLDMARLFTPGGRYRDALPVGGRRRIVREPDGIHLNEEGAKLAAPLVLAALRRDFGG